MSGKVHQVPPKSIKIVLCPSIYLGYFFPRIKNPRRIQERKMRGRRRRKGERRRARKRGGKGVEKKKWKKKFLMEKKIRLASNFLQDI